MNNSYDRQQRSKADGSEISAEFVNNIFQHTKNFLVALYIHILKNPNYPLVNSKLGLGVVSFMALFTSFWRTLFKRRSLLLILIVCGVVGFSLVYIGIIGIIGILVIFIFLINGIIQDLLIWIV